jgi:SAM-dependent methyltransferase
MEMTELKILEKMSQYTFYHTIPLTDTISTPGWANVNRCVKMTLNALRRLYLDGKRVLDIGCRDGLFSFEAEKLGAKEIIAFDNDPSVAASEFLVPYFKSKVKINELNVYDLLPETYGKFDLVIFAGVLYHLRYPVWALKLVRDVMNEGGHLVLETAMFVDDNRLPLMYCPIGSESPYEPTSCTFFNTKGMIATLYSLGLQVDKIDYLENAHLRKEVQQPAKSKNEADFGASNQGVVLDRATFTCRKNSKIIDPEVTKYWDGLHHIHTKDNGAIYCASSN